MIEIPVSATATKKLSPFTEYKPPRTYSQSGAMAQS